MRIRPFVLAAATLLASVLVPAQSHADTITFSNLASGVQSPTSTSYVNTFEPGTYNSATGTTTFGGSSITGTYSGSFNTSTANQYGGAGGQGNFITTSSSYTLTLSSSANYFGLWLSALDPGNQLSFYRGATLLFTYTPTLSQTSLGLCPSSSNGYCGNPNAAFQGQDSGEAFAFVNFYDADGLFNKVVFTQTTNAGFESDNHSVALLNTGGAAVTPEPSSWILALTGMCVITFITVLRRA